MIPSSSRFRFPLLLLLAFLCHAPADAVPNVIVIVADDLSWHDLGCMGTPDVYTPAIDSLALNGVKFTNAYATAPVCSPSRAGLLTGRYQQRFGHETNPGPSLEGVDEFGLPVKEATMGNRFKELQLGYTTGWIGKSHLGSQSQYHPRNRGFDRFWGYLRSHHNYFNANQPANQTDPILDDFMQVPANPPLQYLTQELGTKCLEFIEVHHAQPFFLYAPFSAVHFDDSGELPTPLSLRDELALHAAPSTGIRNDMAATLLGLDHAVAALVAKLVEHNLLENTIIFFTSDNGGDPNFGADNGGLKGRKTDLYEGGIRVPLIVQWKDTIPAQVQSAPVSTLDILPTAIAATGHVIPAAWQLDGVNLLPWLKGQAPAPVRTLYWRVETDGKLPPPPESTAPDVKDGMRAIRQGDFKLVKMSAASSWELYNLYEDPGETNNIASTDPTRVTQMIADYKAWTAQLARPRWAWDDLDYSTPEFELEDVPTGVAAAYTEPPTSVAFQCPELNNETCIASITGHAGITLYRSSGAPFATLSVPSRFLYSMKPRVLNGTTYFSCAAYENDDPLTSGATEIWLLSLGPDTTHRLARRVDDAGGTDHRQPDTVIIGNELYVTYNRSGVAHRCRTGIKLPDYPGSPSGFTTMPFAESHHASGSTALRGTEITHMTAYNDMLFAGQGSTLPVNGSFTGVQILCLDNATGSWVQDAQLIAHLRMEAMENLRFTLADSTPLPGSGVGVLVASFSDVVPQGNALVGIRTRLGPDNWQHSEIHSLSGGVPLCIGAHYDASVAITVQNIFAGISCGEIHSGVFAPLQAERFIWASGPELTGTGPVTGFANANSDLYAACGLSTSGTGGLYKRDDVTHLWSPVYHWLTQENVAAAPEEARLVRGLTTVLDPRGSTGEVLLVARSWTGSIERIDPAKDHAATVELDVRDFLARQWNNNTLRSSAIRIGYNAFTPVTHPVTGELVHLITLWIDSDAHFLIRHRDATYEVADLGYAPNLRATRCIAVSPFAEDALYIGGYDNSVAPTTNTAWIARGEWRAWPQISITQPNPPLLQLAWPVTHEGWSVEASADLSAWLPMGGLPTSSLTTTTQSINKDTSTRGFFRLRRAGP
jgi:arylsulfatase A-like enzyme